LCEIVARVLSRAPAEHRHVAEWASAALLCTAGIKALLSAIEIVSWPAPKTSNVVVAFLVVATGLSLAVWFAQPLLANGGLEALRSTRLERAFGALLVLSILLLNLPLVSPAVVPSWLR
jgi:hypothetical protein